MFNSALTVMRLIDRLLSVYESWLKKQEVKKIIKMTEDDFRSEAMARLINSVARAKTINEKDLTDEEKRDLDNFFADK